VLKLKEEDEKRIKSCIFACLPETVFSERKKKKHGRFSLANSGGSRRETIHVLLFSETTAI
jgi:hypothetical protein